MKFRILLVVAITGMATSVGAHTICTAVADASSGKLLMEQGDCSTRTTPASTFKIAISLMGYDSGFLKDAHNPTLEFHEDYPDWGGAAWRQPTDPARWMKYSVVWFSQQVTESLGAVRFADYTKKFEFGNADVAGDKRHPHGLTHAWIDSSLQISPLEQVAFLVKLVNHTLPVSEHAFAMTDRITEVTRLGDWDIHGKTGTGFPANADGSDDETRGWGWFVGWTRSGGKTLVFARLIQDDGAGPAREPAGLRARDAFLAEFPDRIVPLATLR